MPLHLPADHSQSLKSSPADPLQVLRSRQWFCWSQKSIFSTRVITDPQPFFADEKVSMTTFPSNYSSQSNGAQQEASHDRSYFVSLVLFRVAFFALFVCWLVLKTVKFPFITGLSRPHSKPTEVDTKTLTSVKFESSFSGQWKIKTNSTVSNNVKHQAFIAPFMSRASVPSNDKQALYANVGLASCSSIMVLTMPADGCGWEKPWASHGTGQGLGRGGTNGAGGPAWCWWRSHSSVWQQRGPGQHQPGGRERGQGKCLHSQMGFADPLWSSSFVPATEITNAVRGPMYR